MNIKTTACLLAIASAGVLATPDLNAQTPKPVTSVVIEKQPVEVKIVTDAVKPVTATNPLPVEIKAVKDATPLDVRIAGISPQTPPGFMLPVNIAAVGHSSVPVNSALQHWEHHHQVIDFGIDANAYEGLNKAWQRILDAGHTGWEMVAVSPIPGRNAVIVFMKKPRT